MSRWSVSRRGFWLGLTLALGAMALAGLAWVTVAESDRSLADVQNRGELRVGYAIEAPYAWLQADGTPSGESVEVAREVARRLRLRPVWILTDFDRLIPELQADRFDVVAAGLFVTPGRQQQVRFTRPELRVRPGWLVRAAPARPIPASYAQAGPSSGLRVAVVSGSVEHAAFDARAWPPGQLLVVPDARSGSSAVLTGQADALALSLPAVSAMARTEPAALAAVPAGEGGANLVAMAVRRDAQALASAIDTALDDHLGSPGHLAMLERHGLGPDDLPEPRRARPD